MTEVVYLYSDSGRLIPGSPKEGLGPSENYKQDNRNKQQDDEDKR